MQKKYRLGIDLGSTSLGWCMLILNDENEPVDVFRSGVRIFPDGREAKSNEPLSVNRRGKRGARRNHDRGIERKQVMMEHLVQFGLMPSSREERKALEPLDPYFLRKRALDERLSPHEIGRSLFHLAQRRGFKSNRKLDSQDKETSSMKQGIAALRSALDETGCRTIGEFQYNRMQVACDSDEERKPPTPPIRFKARTKNSKREYDLMLERSMIEDEFHKIISRQKEFHPSILSDDVIDRLHHDIFYQRPLRPVKPGRCLFEPEEERCPKALPSFQRFRLLQVINNLRLLDEHRYDRSLTDAERKTILDLGQGKKEVTYKSIRKKLFKKEAESLIFNHENEKNKSLTGDETAALLSSPKHLGKKWLSLSHEEQDKWVMWLLNPKQDEKLERELPDRLQKTFGIDRDTALNVMTVSLPKFYGHLSQKAILKILPFLAEGLIYPEACKKAGYDHSDFHSGILYDSGDLPYYGEILQRHIIPGSGDPDDDLETRIGKINNPTVHIALNQMRKFINALCRTYGPPEQIVIELARELKMGQKKIDELNRQQARERKRNLEIAKKLKEAGIAVNRSSLQKYKLWEELGDSDLERKCPYTGRQISFHQLFEPGVEIEHILPKSRTFDDRMSNKTLCWHDANRYKGERSPFEAFGESRDGYDWDKIAARAVALPPNKRWRFDAGAMERFEGDGEPIERMLNDTRYMSRLVREYLCFVVPPNQVWSIPGQLTAKLRRNWGFNRFLSDGDDKKRDDHRHHAVDALVVGLTSRSILKRVSSVIGESRERFIEKLGLPYNGFSHVKVRDLIRSIIVSYKPDHKDAQRAVRQGKTTGQLHEETAYGFVKELPGDRLLLSHRVPVSGIQKIEHVESIMTDWIREALLLRLTGLKDDDVSGVVNEFARETGIKHLKLGFEMDRKGVIPIRDKKGNVYKFFKSGSNYCADIFCDEQSGESLRWQAEIISTFEAHQPGFIPNWKREHPAARKVMRLFANDLVALDVDGKTEYRRVKKLNKKALIVYLREHNIARREKSQEDIGEQYSAAKLQRMNARKVGLDIIGRLFDPGVPNESR